MKPDELKKMILSLEQDVVFQFDGKYACINPWNAHKIEVGYDGNTKTYNNISDVMNDKFYHGKSLREIADNLDID
ncbi:MAG: hypothetical protein V8S39_00195 [Lachnospiraceae bacterium]|nr:MAG TPA: WhiA-like protein [Caudoviricetes sp.]